MTPVSLRRQRRTAKLQQLVDAHTASALAKHIGTPKSHVSAILAGRRGIGDDLAAKIERKYEKEPGWMDAADDLVLTPAERAIVLTIRKELEQTATGGTVEELKPPQLEQPRRSQSNPWRRHDDHKTDKRNVKKGS